ncbi:MAG TPA: hypothetical protein VK936_10940 [Longimicrobiales bacterium]|nr:hypothetical protein [Longimicrobiales bacterium]
MSRRTLMPGVALLALALAACAERDTPIAPDALEPAYSAAAAEEGRILADIRRGTARYHRVEAAVADGYMPVSPCVAAPHGGMGYHYLKPSLANGTIDPAAPQMLLYEPRPNGKVELVGVEFVVPPALWQGSDTPRLGGQAFGMDPFGNHALHVWVWRNNPVGMYADFNPRVSCAYAP